MKTILAFFIFLVFNISAIGQEVYVTKTGKKYHNETCRYLKHSKQKISLEDAVEFGYTACGYFIKPEKKVLSKSSSFSSEQTNTTTAKRTIAVQCSSQTKSGARCKRRTTNSSGKCYQH